MTPTWLLVLAALGLVVLVAAVASFLWIVLAATIAGGNPWDVLFIVASMALGLAIAYPIVKKIRKRM